MKGYIMATNAISFVLRSNGNVRFEIEMDNEFVMCENVTEAVSALVAYETRTAGDYDENDWTADVMEWGISVHEPNTIFMRVL